MPSIYQRKPDGVFYDPKKRRLMEHNRYAKRIYWTKDMLDYLRSHFATTFNEELAACIGVSQRTMVRKARELGLHKKPEWLAAVWDEHRMIGQAVCKSKGYPGSFQKGNRANPAGEFKPGHRLTDEQTAKKSDKMRRWYRLHPAEAKAKAMKGWETRRRNRQRLEVKG